MKELVLNEAPRAPIALPPEVQRAFEATRESIARSSSIIWGEHCTECAFPSCYSSCEFYTPRSDMHCRRFAQGIEAVSVPGSALNLTRIQFRKWGKLEGSGPATLRPIAAANALESRQRLLDGLWAALPAPRRIAGSITYRLNERRKQQALATEPASAPTDFLVEAWLEHATSINLTVTMLPQGKSGDGLFQQQITLRQGYNCAVIPCTTISRSMPIDAPFLIQLEVVGEVPDQPVIFGLVEFVERRASAIQPKADTAPAPTKTKTAKCVVWDLDDTLWHGTLVEDGIEGVALKREAVEAIKLLDARGILNSVASKNDEALALKALEHFGLREYFLFPQIGWGPKSDSIRRIAEVIDIGLDTFVFIDDQPFELGEVGAALDTVTLMTPESIATLATHPLFDVPATAESAKRRLMYKDEEIRQRELKAGGTDYIGFLRGCNITLEVSPVTAQSAERIYELTQRTNQLNVTGARFTREQVQAFVEGTAREQGFVLRCHDRFGDYGIIGFCVLEPATAHIPSFFMSCRVQRKRVEHAFFAWLAGRVAEAGGNTLTIAYKKTAKNAASVKLFGELGFKLEETTQETGLFRRGLGDWPEADIVHIALGTK